MPVGPAWTDDEISTMTRMRDEGCTASEISAAMPHRSRNAILGRINRMGLSHKLTAEAIEERKALKKQRQSMETRAQMRRQATALPRLIRGRANAGYSPDGIFERVPQPINQPRKAANVRFLDGGIDHCRYIMDSDEPIESRMICGEPLLPGDPSYCPFHHSICWQPAPRRVPPSQRQPVNQITADPRRRRAVA